MQTCKKCKNEKHIIDFQYIKKKQGYTEVCKKCIQASKKDHEHIRLRKVWDADVPQSFYTSSGKRKKDGIQ